MISGYHILNRRFYDDSDSCKNERKVKQQKQNSLFQTVGENDTMTRFFYDGGGGGGLLIFVQEFKGGLRLIMYLPRGGILRMLFDFSSPPVP